MQFIDSNKIRVYTTPYRGTSGTGSSAKVFDPEARLYTEESVRRIFETFNTYKDDKVANTNGSFIITNNGDWKRTSGAKLEFFIAGYYVCVDTPAFTSYPVYASVILTGTEVVDSFRDYHLNYITESGTSIAADSNKTNFDYSADGINYAFHGVVFSNTEFTTTESTGGTLYCLQLLDDKGNICKNNYLKFSTDTIFGGKNYDDISWTSDTNKSLEELLASNKTYTSEIRGYTLNVNYDPEAPESISNPKFIQSDIRISANNNKVEVIGRAGIIETNGQVYKSTVGKEVTYKSGEDTTGDDLVKINFTDKKVEAPAIKEIHLNKKSIVEFDNYLLDVKNAKGETYLHLNETGLITEKNIDLGDRNNRFGSLYLRSRTTDKFVIGSTDEANGQAYIFSKKVGIQGNTVVKNSSGGAQIKVGQESESSPSVVEIKADNGISLIGTTNINGATTIENGKTTLKAVKTDNVYGDALEVNGSTTFNGSVKVVGKIDSINTNAITGTSIDLQNNGTTYLKATKTDGLKLLVDLNAESNKAKFSDLTTGNVTVSATVNTKDLIASNDIAINNDLNLRKGSQGSEQAVPYGSYIRWGTDDSAYLGCYSNNRLKWSGEGFSTKSIYTDELHVTTPKKFYVHNICIAGDVYNNMGTWKSKWGTLTSSKGYWDVTLVTNRLTGDFSANFTVITSDSTPISDFTTLHNTLQDLIKEYPTGQLGKVEPLKPGAWGGEGAEDLQEMIKNYYKKEAQCNCIIPASGYANDNKDYILRSVGWAKDNWNGETNECPYILLLLQKNGDYSTPEITYIKSDDLNYSDGTDLGFPQISDAVYALSVF